ncbi:MAG: type I-C CRISPR-associated protein Cas8c/Csd1 [Planctomycetota bacterium]
MILQALKEYYDRKPPAPEGWLWKEIPFLAVIDNQGRFVCFQDTREGEGRQKRAKSFLVPSLGEKKGNGIKANLFWENIEYMFGIPVPTKAKENPDPDRVKMQAKAFRDRIEGLRGSSISLDAARKFVKQNHADRVRKDSLWETVLATNQTILLSLQGVGPVTDDSIVRDSVKSVEETKNAIGTCLVTGRREEIARLEPPIKGVRGNDGKVERALVSFNIDSFNSFGKSKNYNSPIGKSTVSAYAAALNHLFSRDSKQRMQVGDASTVFWAAKSEDVGFETDFSAFFGESPKDDPDRGTRVVEGLFSAVKTGAYADDRSDRRFYVLGLAPNASRIAVRFWIVNTIAAMAGRIAQHFEGLRIAHGPKERETLSLFRLLVSTAVQGKAENIPPNLGGDTMRAILEGLPYPQTLLQGAIRRIRAEREVTYPRAALIKACLNRSSRYRNPNGKEELSVALDETNANVGYRLGRLFATLEKIQSESHPGINATIRDKFYSAASSSPVTVFGNLMRLKNHHLNKLDHPGRKIFFEKLMGEIMSAVDANGFPAHLRLDDQGRFAIGYYHQMQKFYEKREV